MSGTTEAEGSTPWWMLLVGLLGAPSVLGLVHNMLELRGHIVELIEAWRVVTAPVRDWLGDVVTSFVNVRISTLGFDLGALLLILTLCTLRAEVLSGNIKGHWSQHIFNVFFMRSSRPWRPSWLRFWPANPMGRIGSFSSCSAG